MSQEAGRTGETGETPSNHEVRTSPVLMHNRGEPGRTLLLSAMTDYLRRVLTLTTGFGPKSRLAAAASSSAWWAETKWL
jgi:hypothetical protein